MVGLTNAIRAFIATSPLAHVVTLGADGAPQVSVAWVGIEGHELVIGTLHDQAKLENLRRDPRIAMSFAAPGHNEYGLGSLPRRPGAGPCHRWRGGVAVARSCADLHRTRDDLPADARSAGRLRHPDDGTEDIRQRRLAVAGAGDGLERRNGQGGRSGQSPADGVAGSLPAPLEMVRAKRNHSSDRRPRSPSKPRDGSA